MTIDDKAKDEKLQYNVNREAAKVSALLSCKIDKYKYLRGEEILSSDQSRIMEQAKFMYSPLGKAFEEQTKTIEDKGIKQVEALKALKPEENQELDTNEGLFQKNMRNNEIKNVIKKWEEKIKRGDLKYEVAKYVFDFQQYEMIKSFGESIYTSKINIDKPEIVQTNLVEIMVNFNNKSRPKSKEDKVKKIF